MSLKKLIEFGRKSKGASTSTRGALIDLNGKIAYITNERRSFLYKMILEEEVGSGVFYAGEAPIMSEKVRDRGEKVLFEWKEGRVIRRVFVPSKKPIKETSEAVFKKWYVNPEVLIPVTALDLLDPDILTTRLRVSGDRLHVKQTRADGTVSLENEIVLSRFLAEVNYPDSGEVTIFTSDLIFIREFTRKPIYIHIEEGKPISLRTTLNFGAILEGLISYLVYER